MRVKVVKTVGAIRDDLTRSWAHLVAARLVSFRTKRKLCQAPAHGLKRHRDSTRVA